MRGGGVVFAEICDGWGGGRMPRLERWDAEGA